ncbi:MAG: hypothetical protein ABSD67_00740 [Terracidiphilus sp.]|jgi:hypothetical protein
MAKRQATSEEQKQIKLLLNRSAKWHFDANKRLSQFCLKLGYPQEVTRTSQEWLNEFGKSLLTTDFWSERRSILALNYLSDRRQNRILFALFLFGQHGRIQFQSPMRIDPGDGSPFEEMRGNNHNLDNLLLRTILYLCREQAPAAGRIARITRTALCHDLGEKGIEDITPNRVARWARVADHAAGVAARDIETLRMTCVQTEGPAWKKTQARAFLHFRAAWVRMMPKSRFLAVALCAFYLYGIYWLLSASRHVIRHLAR